MDDQIKTNMRTAMEAALADHRPSSGELELWTRFARLLSRSWAGVIRKRQWWHRGGRRRRG